VFVLTKWEKKEYIRDGRAPIPVSEKTSRTMSAIKAKNTKPEIDLRKALRKARMAGYRLHWAKAPGRPDIAYPGKKLAIFVHGCFWHRCPYCGPTSPKTHKEFWTEKFRKNQERDKRKIQELERNNWKVFVIWECQINNELPEAIERIKNVFFERGGNIE